MPELLKLLLLIASFLFGVLCISSPITVSQIIIRWTKFASGENLKNDHIQNASDLITNHPEEFKSEYAAHLSAIQRTGYVAITVSLIGACLALLPA